MCIITVIKGLDGWLINWKIGIIMLIYNNYVIILTIIIIVRILIMHRAIKQIIVLVTIKIIKYKK